MKKIEGRFFISIFSQLSSGDASDSICPKGWGMAKFEGDGSYRKLIAIIYGINKTGIIQKYQEKNIKIRIDEIIMQYPIFFIRFGNYDFSGGYQNRSSSGYFWENVARSGRYGSSLYYSNQVFNTQVATNGKGDGQSLRCVAK